MPGHRDNLVALRRERAVPFHTPTPQNIGGLIFADSQPQEIPRGIKRFSHYPVVGRFLRFFTWWFIISGIYASSSVCPFCGQMGCPVGAASAGVVGGFFALVIGKGQAVWQRLSGWLSALCSFIHPSRESKS
jgi:hypothetical protein